MPNVAAQLLNELLIFTENVAIVLAQHTEYFAVFTKNFSEVYLGSNDCTQGFSRGNEQAVKVAHSTPPR